MNNLLLFALLVDMPKIFAKQTRGFMACNLIGKRVYLYLNQVFAALNNALH